MGVYGKPAIETMPVVYITTQRPNLKQMLFKQNDKMITRQMNAE